MRFCGWWLGLLGNDDFMEHYWTTVNGTIFYSNQVQYPYAYPELLEHELNLLEDQDYKEPGEWGWKDIWWVFRYLFLPVPIFLAWFRWKSERSAYLHQLTISGEKDKAVLRAGVESVIHALWVGYMFTWPRFFMRRWFWKQLRLY